MSIALIEAQINDFLKGIIDIYGFLSFDDYYKFYKNIFFDSVYDFTPDEEILTKDEFIEKVLSSYVVF